MDKKNNRTVLNQNNVNCVNKVLIKSVHLFTVTRINVKAYFSRVSLRFLKYILQLFRRHISGVPREYYYFGLRRCRYNKRVIGPFLTFRPKKNKILVASGPKSAATTAERNNNNNNRL